MSDDPLTSSVEVAAILQDGKLQVRAAMNTGTVARYESAYRNGCELPPVTVAVVNGTPKLVDGWHRVAALERLGEPYVNAVVYRGVSQRDARWMAAAANLTNGLPLKAREMRKVFRAYIHARQHRGPKNQLKSFREMARDLNGVVSYSTIRRWCQKDFPKLYREMSGETVHNADPVEKDGENHMENALHHLQQLLAVSRQVKTPEERGRLVEEAQRVTAEIAAGGEWAPQPDDF